MSKKSILLFLVCFISSSPFLFSQDSLLTRQGAIGILLNEVIVPATLNKSLTAFLVKEPLKPGDQLESFMGAPFKSINRPTWFAWLNDTPEAFFAHTTRFVLIDQQTRRVEILKSDWWPVLNGRSLFMSDEELKDLDLIIYSDMHRKP